MVLPALRLAVTLPQTRLLTDGGEQFVFADVLERAKIDRTRRFHDWRHTFASRLADAGVSTEIIKKMGGWTQDGTALRYQHSDRIAELRGAIDAMARLAAGGGNQSMPSASAVKESANALP